MKMVLMQIFFSVKKTSAGNQVLKSLIPFKQEDLVRTKWVRAGGYFPTILLNIYNVSVHLFLRVVRY